MTDLKRRKLVTLLGASATVVPVSALVSSLPSHAADAPVDPESAQAKALSYIAVSDTDGKECGGCALFAGGDEKKGTCPLFPGSSIPAEALCSAFVPKS